MHEADGRFPLRDRPFLLSPRRARRTRGRGALHRAGKTFREKGRTAGGGESLGVLGSCASTGKSLSARNGLQGRARGGEPAGQSQRRERENGPARMPGRPRNRQGHRRGVGRGAPFRLGREGQTPPKLSAPRFPGRLKGESGIMPQAPFGELKSRRRSRESGLPAVGRLALAFRNGFSFPSPFAGLSCAAMRRLSAACAYQHIRLRRSKWAAAARFCLIAFPFPAPVIAAAFLRCCWAALSRRWVILV